MVSMSGVGVVVSTHRGAVRLLFPQPEDGQPAVYAKEHQHAFGVTGRLQKVDGSYAFTMPATPRVYRWIRKHFTDRGIPVSFDEAAEQVFKFDAIVGNDHRVGFVRNMRDPLYDPVQIPLTKTGPWDHQRRTFWFVVDRLGGLHADARGGALLGLDMGCGKTKVAIDLIANYGWRSTLVVCPAKVVPVWPLEWEKHGAIDARVVSLAGSTQERARQMCTAIQFRNKPVICVTNYEAFDYKVMQEAAKSIAWDCVICDESHRLKSQGGKRSKFFAGFADHIPVRLCMTGTKDPNTPLDIYAQARFVDRSYYGTSFARFRGEYAIMGGYSVNGNPVQVLGFKNEADLAKKNFQFCIEFDADEVQDLPEEHHVDVPVILDPKTREQYDELEKEFVLEVEDDEISVANVMVKLGKLQEITGGFIRNPDTQQIYRLGTEKIDALEDKVQDIPPGDPVVVFCRLRPDLDSIAEVCDRLKRPHMEVSGRINQLDAWQRASGNEVLIAQISSGKEGIDLTRSPWCFYYSLGYQPGEFSQSKKRQHRPGQQAERVTFFHLVATGTVDEKIYTAIRKKQRVIDTVRTMAKRIGLPTGDV